MKARTKVKKNFHFFHISLESPYESSEYQHRKARKKWRNYYLKYTNCSTFWRSSGSRLTKWGRKKYLHENTFFWNKGLRGKYRECRGHHSRVPRTNSLSRWNYIYSRYPQRLIWRNQNPRKRNRRRRVPHVRNRRIWEIHRAYWTIQTHRGIHIWKWSGTRQSMNRNISPPRDKPDGYIWWRTNKSCSRKNTPFKTWFPPPRRTNKFYRSPKSRMVREVSDRKLERWIPYCITWPRILR